MTKTGQNIYYEYDTNGIRIRKTVNGVWTEYLYHGKQLTHLSQYGIDLHFFYDAQGRPAVVDYNGVKYGYVHNLQGDILGSFLNTVKVIHYT